MKTYLYSLLALKLALLFNVIVVYQAIAQVYSKGINSNGTSLGFLELRVVETDPILKQAKETTPFDKPFFLKIKRLTRKSSSGTLTETTTDLKTQPGNNPATTITTKFEETIPRPNPPKMASIISKLNLARLDNTALIAPISEEIYTVVTPTGAVYQEDGNSDFIFIRIDNLRTCWGIIFGVRPVSAVT